jgi:hypothetical protein
VDRSEWSKNSINPLFRDFEMCVLPQLGHTTKALLRDPECISVSLKAEKLTKTRHQEVAYRNFNRVFACLHTGGPAEHGVVDEQNDDCSDYGDQDAVKIHASHSYVANEVEEPSAHNGPDDS